MLLELDNAGLSGGDCEGEVMNSGRVVYFLLVLVSSTVILAQEGKWPIVRPLEEERVFVKPERDNSDMPFVTFIKDSEGASVYKLECHNGNYEDESELNFSGDFQCVLFSVKEGSLSSANLLASDTKSELSTDWWNRGRMRAVQLRGECARYPEYNADRTFKLRGMLLRLHFVNVKWGENRFRSGEPELVGFTFIVKVVLDRSARTSRAELPKSLKPPSACYP